MTSTIVTMPADDSVIIIERVFDAPRALVFKMFTDPFHLAQFWGPHGSTNPVCEMDLRPGGLWRQVMRFPNGSNTRMTASTSRSSNRSASSIATCRSAATACWTSLPPPQMVTTHPFEEVAGRTKLTAHVRATSLAARDQAVQMGFAETVSQARSARRLPRTL